MSPATTRKLKAIPQSSKKLVPVYLTCIERPDGQYQIHAFIRETELGFITPNFDLVLHVHASQKDGAKYIVLAFEPCDEDTSRMRLRRVMNLIMSGHTPVRIQPPNDFGGKPETLAHEFGYIVL